MSWSLVFTESYNKQAARFLKRHPNLRDAYRKTLLLLEANPFHPSLRLNGLQGRLKALHTVSINLSYRITIDLLIDGQQIIPIAIGDHHSVYR